MGNLLLMSKAGSPAYSSPLPRKFTDCLRILPRLLRIVIEKNDEKVYNKATTRQGGKSMENEIRLGDVVQTRKPHPCGSDTWVVIRTGADIKIKCQGCGRIVMLDREVFLKRRKKLLAQGPAAE